MKLFNTLKSVYAVTFLVLVLFAQAFAQRQPAPQASTIFDLQRYATVQTVNPPTGGQARLFNLNPNIGSWYVLELSGVPQAGAFHLEVPNPESTRVSLVPGGLQIGSALCDVTNPSSSHYLPNLARTPALFVRLCGTQVSLRQDRNGKSQMVDAEIAAQFWQVRPNGPATPAGAPRAALINPAFQNAQADLRGLAPVNSVTVGQWAPSRHHSGVYYSSVSISQLPANLPDPRNSTDTLAAEGAARATMVAMNMNQFRIGWSHGPLLPGLGHWNRMYPTQSRPDSGGPDGLMSASPLQIQTGVMNPIFLPQLAAVMCGGFQRFHGRMRVGPYAGKYYGFIQEGVVLSTLSEGLVTFIIYKNGSFDIKTWQASDVSQIPNIRYARQNGIPLVEGGVPGEFLAQRIRGGGNWSGSLETGYKASRSGVCISEQNGNRFMIYGYFDSATPSGMAKTFQAYGCRTAMHLDMNNPQWAYFGLLSRDPNSGTLIEWPTPQMSPKDRNLNVGGRQVRMPRFIAEPDRDNPGDFFYILRR